MGRLWGLAGAYFIIPPIKIVRVASDDLATGKEVKICVQNKHGQKSNRDNKEQ